MPARALRTASDTTSDRLVLSDHAHAQPVFHVQELLHLALKHPGHRNAGPLGHDLRHVLVVHLFLQDLLMLLHLRQFPGFCFKLLSEFQEFAVAQFGCLTQISLALGLIRVDPGLFYLFLDGPYLLDAALFRLPLRPLAAPFLRKLGNLLFDLREPLARRRVLLLLHCLALDLELGNPAFHLIELRGHAVDLHAKPRCGFIDQVNGLVR